MNYTRFLQISRDVWNEFFSRVQSNDSQGLYDKNGRLILYPKILLITETKDYFVAELMGASETFNGLTIKGHKENSIHRYLYQFNYEGVKHSVELNGEDITFSGLLFTRDSDLEKIKTRFPFVKQAKSILHVNNPNHGSMFKFNDKSNFITLEDIILVNSYENSIRVKQIIYLAVSRKDTTAAKYSIWLKNKIYGTDKVKAIMLAMPEKGQIIATASQFSNT